jgi:hypothetical protein
MGVALDVYASTFSLYDRQRIALSPACVSASASAAKRSWRGDSWQAGAAGSAIGYAMGRNALFDRMADPWVVMLLALPALVIIVLAYVWRGLNETAAIGAVGLNKLPNAIVIIREGVIREGVRATWGSQSKAGGSPPCSSRTMSRRRSRSPTGYSSSPRARLV